MKKLIKAVLIGIAIITAYLIVIPVVILQYGKNRIYTDTSSISQYEVAIVFGAGVKSDGTPTSILEDRLDTAYELYSKEKVNKLLLSGDSAAEDYSEPQAMYDYLVFTLDVPEDAILKDMAGLRTYDTCARAKNIWDIDEAILISQGYHLSRAIFTCNSLGVESTGYSATDYPYAGEVFYKIREILAIHKAVLDVYILNPEYKDSF